MDLSEHYFNEIIQSAGAFYWIICLFLVFFKVPQAKEYLPYRKAKYCLAASFFVMGSNLFAWLWIFTDDWSTLSPYVLSLDVILFYLAIIFFGYSFTHLLDPHYLNKTRVTRDFTTWGITTLLMLLSLDDSLEAFRPWMIGFAFFFLTGIFVCFLRRFYLSYEKRQKRQEEYFSEDIKDFMFWMKKSLFFLSMSWILAVLTLFFGICFNYFYQFYMVTLNLYIAISFVNYGYLYGKLNMAEVSPKEEKDMEETQRKGKLENLERLFDELMPKWLAEKRYLTTQLTIDDLAAEMGTNKLYMSRYINNKYGVNFSTWITNLRISEAKEYMQEHPELKQEEVAFHSGFSSSSYFSKVFSRMEGVTPAAWRKEMLKMQGE